MTIAILVLLAQAAAPATAIEAPMPDGFETAFERDVGSQSIEERVPRGETVERWSRMVTLQNFRGVPLTARQLVDRVAAGFADACPGSPPARISGTDGEVVARITCNRNPATGLPETMFARAIDATNAIGMVQYAFRSVPDDAEAAAARAYLASARLCPAGGCAR